MHERRESNKIVDRPRLSRLLRQLHGDGRRHAWIMTCVCRPKGAAHLIVSLRAAPTFLTYPDEGACFQLKAQTTMLPPHSVAAGPATTTIYHESASVSPSPFPGLGSENWSSLIGIVTAIVGNVLISFALNMQRYAHIRLEQEWQEKEKQRKRRSASYGTSQPTIADERAKSNMARKYYRPRQAEYTVEDEQEGIDEGVAATETDPLLSSIVPVRAGSRSRSRPTLLPTESSGSANGTSERAYKQKSYLKSPYWWTGIILMTTGEAGNFLAYGFAPASIVSPLGVVALISNCIIAPFMLKERFRTRDGLGVMVAVAGAVTVVLSASDNNPKLGPGDIWDLITRWEFEAYLGITIAVIIALMVASNRFGDKSILIDLGLVGLFGGYTALSTKGVASMLSYTLWRAITFPVTYLLVAILVFTAVMQIKYVNRALQRFDATQVIPTQFVLFTLSVILGSAILYRDFERTSGGDAGKFTGGCAMTFLGVWLITSGRPLRNNEDEEDREPEGEDAINLIDSDRYQDDVDSMRDEASSSTRRSSTLRAASPPIAINTRVLAQETSYPATPDITFTSDNTLPPATPESIHEAPSPLTANPWEQEQTTLARPPPSSKHSTLSTPVLPTEAVTTPQVSRSSPDLPINAPLPHTPVRGISDSTIPVTPGTTSSITPHLRRIGTVERLGARNSIPGPLLASPLSTSLSAMVADLKRGGSLRGHSSLRETDSSNIRRRESVLGIGAGEVDGNSDGVGEPLNRRRTATDEASTSRQRGFSGTFNEIWRGLRGGGSTEDIGGERAVGEDHESHRGDR
ncbi:DUF803-domain-containing protein [Lojkania enalia]|uniref:DUF803-domain-containing protein n=1 Tax=Lojkania enalia TaxID=147567 RepID=A0A9P4JXZ0_9PLEO|nr:DUF803-domain-containing protein [Didymosphaeria enalia]